MNQGYGTRDAGDRGLEIVKEPSLPVSVGGYAESTLPNANIIRYGFSKRHKLL
jgi:hypothetical protein